MPTQAKLDQNQCHRCREQQTAARHLRACTGCYQVRYCSKACQKAHWPRHKFDCRGYRLKPADTLVSCCWEDEFPEDQTVLEGFHFLNFTNAFGRQSLFVLYRDMVTSAGVSAQKLDRWSSNRCLREGIIHHYTRQKITKLFQWQLEGSLQ